MYSLLVFLGVAMIAFFLFQSLGDPATFVAGQSGDRKTIENIRKDLRLDLPAWKQLLFYLNDLSPVSIYPVAEIERKKIGGYAFGSEQKLVFKLPYLGVSFQSKKQVSEILGNAFPATFVLAFAAMLVACLAGLLLGILAALYKDTWIDRTAIVSSIAGVSAPSFFMAILMAYGLGIVLHDYTGLPFTGSLFEVDETTGERYIALQNLVLPCLTLSIRPLSIIAQLARSSMSDVLQQDYIRTAKAMGISKQMIVLRYALKNALNPIITSVTGWFAELLAGSFFIEYIFGWNGIGKVAVDALSVLDLPVLMGAILFSACIFILMNLFADLMYRLVDPRIGRS